MGCCDELVLSGHSASEVPQCSDFDEDCDDVPDKVHCYLYDPVRGFCPYLRARTKEGTRDHE